MTDEGRDPTFEQLLQYLLETRGFDFSGYKRSSLQRRVAKRMSQVGAKDYAAYIEYLQTHHDEFGALFNTILINVTSYFRDAAAWEYLRQEILPRLIDGKERHELIRVWCAGASSGEEAYTIAMQLSEALGSSKFRDRAKIYATDVDEEALSQARLGRAQVGQLEEVPQSYRDKYFEQVGAHYMLRAELRRSIIFGRHDLLRDAPISRIDLLICRNTLMYFDAETQGKILARFHYALNDKGYLFLGKAEMLLSRDALFVPAELKQRVFTKVPKVSLRERLLVLADAGSLDPANYGNRQSRMSEAVADASPVAQVVVDAGGFVLSTNARARSLFGLVAADVGRPLQDLEVSYLPLELRSRIDEAYRDRRPVLARDVERRTNGEDVVYFDVEISPLVASDGTILGAGITFSDVTSYNRIVRELDRSRHELETTSEELQATNEELETTNEELQSTVEELETTNEELQSSNEELETMNEELESTNSELGAINTELQQRSSQLDNVNTFLQQIMSNLQLGIAVLDRDLRIRLWNRRAEDLWGVRAEEAVGQPLLGLDIGLPMTEIATPIREVLSDGKGPHEFRVRAINRRGKPFTCRLQTAPMADTSGRRGLILLMEAEAEAGA
ncbi:MAG TPA: CheR family methyltransferase [Candidatus Dormibacteraeota bacterium]|nr:CheR family methyltransferase [Candidatus Dormibacteraeota bacterium]